MILTSQYQMLCCPNYTNLLRTDWIVNPIVPVALHFFDKSLLGGSLEESVLTWTKKTCWWKSRNNSFPWTKKTCWVEVKKTHSFPGPRKLASGSQEVNSVPWTKKTCWVEINKTHSFPGPRSFVGESYPETFSVDYMC